MYDLVLVLMVLVVLVLVQVLVIREVGVCHESCDTRVIVIGFTDEKMFGGFQFFVHFSFFLFLFICATYLKSTLVESVCGTRQKTISRRDQPLRATP